MEHYFENYAAEGNVVLKAVARELGSPEDYGHAFRILQAVFHTVRDRITPQESLHFISELPMALKGLYVHNWKVHEKPKKYETKNEFLDEVCQEILSTEGGFESSAEQEVKAVFNVLKKWVSEGEIRHVKGQLTPAIAALIEG